MQKGPQKRFDESKILDRILYSVENSENILEQVVKILKEVTHYHWVGIYLVEGDNLVLKHFLGRPTEHTKIKIGQGICGAAVVDEQTIIVSDVSADNRYIACSVETKSEIVVPIWKGDRIIGEIDIDSDLPDAFAIEDKKMLEKIADVLGDTIQ
ncbi:MAG: GAF domain-containing protein [Methanomassiliicoccales archaeon]|nr:MAG: GAF domain-containing protein [Methanomassiliicoccales archaeon]